MIAGYGCGNRLWPNPINHTPNLSQCVKSFTTTNQALQLSFAIVNHCLVLFATVSESFQRAIDSTGILLLFFLALVICIRGVALLIEPVA